MKWNGFGPSNSLSLFPHPKSQDPKFNLGLPSRFNQYIIFDFIDCSYIA